MDIGGNDAEMPSPKRRCAAAAGHPPAGPTWPPPALEGAEAAAPEAAATEEGDKENAAPTFVIPADDEAPAAAAGGASASSSAASPAAPPATAGRAAAREGRERRRADPLWTPLTELGRDEYESAKVPLDTLKSSHAGLEKGQVARLLGLKARAELNGACGRLVCYDSGCERWHVRLLSGLETIKVRPGNLEAAADAGGERGEDVDELASRLASSMEC